MLQFRGGEFQRVMSYGAIAPTPVKEASRSSDIIASAVNNGGHTCIEMQAKSGAIASAGSLTCPPYYPSLGSPGWKPACRGCK